MSSVVLLLPELEGRENFTIADELERSSLRHVLVALIRVSRLHRHRPVCLILAP